MAKGRTLKEFYIFIHDAAFKYYEAHYNDIGMPVISVCNPVPQPLRRQPKNIKDFKPAFGTNKNYMSGVRSATNPFTFLGDGADILRYFDYKGKGFGQELYIRIMRYNESDGKLYLYYNGRFDFKTKKDDPIKGYTINVTDYGVWAMLSQNDDVPYQIECNQTNPKAIPVLFDGINLKSKYTYQTVPSEFIEVIAPLVSGNPFDVVLVNTDGDSSGIIVQSQHWLGPIADQTGNFVYKPNKANHIKVYGNFMFQFKCEDETLVHFQFGLRSNLSGFSRPLAEIQFNCTNAYGTVYSMPFEAEFDLLPGEELTWSILQLLGGSFSHDWHILPKLTNFYIETTTKADPTIVYCLRPLDLLQDLVSKATNNKYVANSNFFAENDTLVATCGGALRGLQNAYITTSFRDWFQSYDYQYWLAFRVLFGQLWVELFKTVYDQNSTLFNVGEIIEVSTEDAVDYLFNAIEVGSPKQDYRHPSGRLEFNTTNKFSITQFNIKNTLSLISKYRTDGYGMEFIRLDYQNDSSKDNSGDDSVFLVDIKNELGSSGATVENFVDITVNALPLAPIIYYPLPNDVILNNKPTIRGVCEALTTVNIYVDGVFDGSTVSDANGVWVYDIITALDYFVDGVTSGVHTIEATFTDLTGTVESRSITLVDDVQATVFTNFINNQNIYNNKPTLQGLGEQGIPLLILLDGLLIGSVTPDNSNRWFFQMPVMSNAAHTIQVGTATITLNVNSFVETPIITSFSDGFQIVDQLPLVEGVAKPGTKVDLWLDYYSDESIGTAFADANGNWAIQIVPLFQPDGVTVLTPIPNGNHIISTSLNILTTPINLVGYILNRPAYSTMTGVIDNTVFNTRISPKAMLIARMSFFKSVFIQQPDIVFKFETGDKNQQFSRTLGAITIKENENLTLSDFVDDNSEPVFLPIILKAKVKSPNTFYETMDNFNNGGLIESDYQGFPLYALPIGDMVVNDITNEFQEWNLLLSIKTPLTTLLQLSTPGSIFKIMDKSVFRSDYNMLHFVQYNYQLPARFSAPEIYEDWFKNRNQDWRENPFYIQKVQQSEGEVRDQIITSGIGAQMSLGLYKCSDASLVNIYIYNVIAPSPIQSPDILQETIIDWSAIDEGDYFFVMFAGGGNSVAISERIRVAEKHEGTILIDASNTKNKTGAIFSTGFRSVIRVEGLLKKFQPSFENIVQEDEVGDFEMEHSVFTKKRTVLIGDPYGTPDYVYLKVAAMMALDSCKIEQYEYTLDQSASFEPQDPVIGHPLYHFAVDVRLKENEQGTVFASGDAGFKNSVILVVDESAFGYGGSGLTKIELKPE